MNERKYSFECKSIFNSFQEEINGIFQRIIIPKKGFIDFEILSQSRCIFHLKFDTQENSTSTKYEVKLNLKFIFNNVKII